MNIPQLPQKAQGITEAATGAAVTIWSVIADITDVVQAIGVWAGTALALLGLYHAIKRELKNRKK